MKLRSLAVLFLVILTTPTPAWAQERTHDITPEDYATLATITEIALSPDGKSAAACCMNEKVVRLVDVDTGQVVRDVPGFAHGVSFSPDGKLLLTGGADMLARLWDVATGRELHVFRGHRNWVSAVSFSPDGRRLLTAGGGAKNGEENVAGNDFGIRIWPLPDSLPRAVRVRTIDLGK